jgi:uncharacterized protein YgiM (DUF1202 family)
MRLTVVVLIASVVMLGLISTASGAEIADSKFPFTGRTNAYDINVRSGASLNYEIITVLKKDELVLVKGERLDWYSIRFPAEILCWVTKNFIDEDGTVNSRNVNVRSGPGLKHKVIVQVDRDDRVRIVKTSADGKWLGIVPPQGARLWVYKKFIDRAGGPSTYKNYLERKNNARKLLIGADKFKDDSLKLGYNEINFDTVRDRYQQIVDNYSEFEQSKIAAKRIKDVNAVQKKMLEDVRREIQAEEKKEKKEEAEWEALKKDLKYKSFRGILRIAPSTVKDDATHVLVWGHDNICYLRSDVINLDDHLYKTMKVWGHVLPDKVRRLRVVVVDKIKLKD